MPVKEERNVIGYDADGRKITEITLHERLPYSNRSVPLVYKCAFSATNRTVWIDFGDFRIDYEGSYIGLAMNQTWKVIASDVKGKQLGEAVAISLEKGAGFAFRETHFDENGAVCFSAKTFVDFDGIKRKESETIGQKRSDYFFLLRFRE